MNELKGNTKRIILVPSILIIIATIFVIGCGSSDAPEPAATAAAPAATEAMAATQAPAPTQAPAATQAPASTQAPATRAPTAQPQPTAEPAGAMVHPGTVTVLNTVWGPELFTTWAWGEVMGYNRQLHSYWMIGSRDVEILPGVATKWEVAPNGLTWDFTIRKGVKFHHGEEITIDDAVFTFNSTYGEQAKVDGGANVLTIARGTEKIEAVSPETVRLTHSQPFAYMPFILTDMATNNNGALLPKAYFEEVGRDGYDAAPIGAGPFQYVRHTFNDEMVFERFDDYWNPERSPNFTTLHMRLVPEASTRVSALIAGQADIVDANLQVKKQIEDSDNRVVISKEAAYMWLFIPGCEDVTLPCNKKAFRQAMDYAVDKQLIVDQLYGPDVAEVKGFSFVFPSSLGYSPGLDPFPYDPEKARDLLAEAGYPNGEGLPKQVINTWVAGDVPFLPEQARLIAQFWKDNLGIEAEVNVGDEVATRERWMGGQLAGQFVLRPNESRWDTTGGMLALYGDFTRGTHLSAKREDIKQIALDAAKVVDPSKRQEVMADAWMLLREEHYEWTTGITHNLWGVGPRIGGWEPWPLVAYLTGVWTININE